MNSADSIDLNTRRFVVVSFLEFNCMQLMLIYSEDHLRNTAFALGKDPKEVTHEELANHWIIGGGRDYFNSHYHRSDLDEESA